MVNLSAGAGAVGWFWNARTCPRFESGDMSPHSKTQAPIRYGSRPPLTDENKLKLELQQQKKASCFQDAFALKYFRLREQRIFHRGRGFLGRLFRLGFIRDFHERLEHDPAVMVEAGARRDDMSHDDVFLEAA